jgi:glutathione S-transferase
MLKIWGRANSLNVQKVLITCTELGLPFERIEAGLAFGVVQTPEYKAMNPNSVVPTIDDDGFVLWESNVIVRYLCGKYSAGKVWPVDVQARADIERWMDWQQTCFNGPLTTVFWGTVRQPGAVPEAEIEKAQSRLADLTAMLEVRLAGRRWLSGDAFGMADLVLASGVHRWMNLPVERPTRERLEAYYRALMQRPSAQGHLTLPLT